MRPAAAHADLARDWVLHRDRIALDDGRREIGYAELDRTVLAVSRGLAALGAKRLGLVAENGLAWALVRLAAVRCGLPLCALPRFFSTDQLRSAIGAAGLDLVLTDDPALAEQLAGGARCTPVPGLGSPVYAAALAAPQPSEPFERVTFTSGSSGSPKGVKLAEASLLRVADSLRRATDMRPDDRHLCALPLAVLLEEVGGLLRGLRAGARVLLLPPAERGLSGSTSFDAERFARALVERRATSTILVPEMLAGWLAVLERGRVPRPSTLRFVGVGGAPVPRALLARAAALELPVYEGYGMSEAASVVTLGTAHENRPGTAGRPLPHARVRIGADGEILVAGTLCQGYLGRPGARPDADGFLATGDVGELDAKGFLTVRGRKDERIVTSFGRNVSPEWVERELECEPEVLRAAVVGAGRPWPCAVVVARGDGDRSDDVARAIERANLRLPDYARVRGFVLARAPFDVADGTATPKGTPRRAAIAALHGSAIERSYTERLGA